MNEKNSWKETASNLRWMRSQQTEIYDIAASHLRYFTFQNFQDEKIL